MGRLTCELQHRGMTALHRVGLAGLYMTLDAFDRDPQTKSELHAAGLRWSLQDQGVELELAPKRGREALGKLFDSAFRVEHGFFKLPGLERGGQPTAQQQYLLYQGLLGTFLQHGNTRSFDRSKAGTRTIEIDDKVLRLRNFSPIRSYAHQTAHNDFLTGAGGFVEHVKVAGSSYPGGAQRQTASGFSSSCLQEPTALAFCLAFAPVGAIYFQVRSRRHQDKARTALVLPPISSLARYARLRRLLAQHGVLDLTAASPTDAALRFALVAKAKDALGELLDRPIRVMTFGTLPWSKQQTTRTATYAVTPGQLRGLHNYELASAIFQNTWQTIAAKRDAIGDRKEPEHHFVRPFTAREMVADNVAAGRYWYAGFAEYMSGKETRTSLQYERKELSEMTQQAEYDHPNERIFIKTCHEAWRRQLGQLGDRSRREGASFQRLATGEYERHRSSLARCKNAAVLRATLTDFWARAGSLPALQEGWSDLLPLLDDGGWRKARDLALLALASYPPSDREEAEALTETADAEESDEP